MPRVASEASVLHAPRHDPGSRHRPAANESGEPSSPFALLLDAADTPKAPERGSRAGPASSMEATGQRPKPPERSDGPKDRTADASQDPSPKTTDAQAAEDAPAHDECDKDEADTSLTIALGNADDPNATPPAATPPAAIVPVGVEIVPAAQGGEDETAVAGDLARSVPAEAITPALPEPPAPSPGNQAGASDETTRPSAQPIDGPLAELTSEASGSDPTPPPPYAGEPATDAPDVTTSAPTGPQPTTPPGIDAPEEQVAQTAQTGQDAKDAPGAARAAPPPDLDKPRPKPGTQPVAGDEPKATTTASEPDEQVDAAKPESTERPAGEPHRPHRHADAAKPDEQPLGQQVSDAARGAKPPSEAVHAVLQAHDRAAGTLTAPAPAAAQAAGPASDAAVPIAGLAVEIAARAQAGSNRFEIRLDPPELGRIDVRLDIDRNGQVTSRLVVERVETLEQLRRDAADLERALQQAGLKTTQDGLQFSLRQQGFAGRDDNSSSSNAARLVVPDPDLATPVDALVASYGRMARTSGIDIRV